MALLEDAFGGWSGLLLGVGAVVVFPSIGPAVGSVIRPTAKALIKGSLIVSDQLAGLAGAAAGQMRDLVADAREETTVRVAGSSAPRPVPKAARP